MRFLPQKILVLIPLVEMRNGFRNEVGEAYPNDLKLHFQNVFISNGSTKKKNWWTWLIWYGTKLLQVKLDCCSKSTPPPWQNEGDTFICLAWALSHVNFSTHPDIVFMYYFFHFTSPEIFLLLWLWTIKIKTNF